MNNDKVQNNDDHFDTYSVPYVIYLIKSKTSIDSYRKRPPEKPTLRTL